MYTDGRDERKRPCHPSKFSVSLWLTFHRRIIGRAERDLQRGGAATFSSDYHHGR